MFRHIKHLLLVILVMLGCAAWEASHEAQAGEILWSNKLDCAADLAYSDGSGEIVPESGRGGVLFFTLTNSAQSSARSFALPVERLRGRFVFVGADIKAESISAKPTPWNGIKVMVRIDSPSGSQWPQPEIPAGSFDWRRYSRRILVPTNATAVTLVLGMEHVSGKAWFDDVRVVLAKEAGDAPAASENAPIFRGHSLPRLRGAMIAPDSLTEQDLGVLAGDWSGNLVRWQLIRYGVPPTETGFDGYGRWLERQLNQLDRGLTWAAKMGVKVVVDLHSPPGGTAISGGYQAALGSIWTDTNAQKRFVEVWRKIATRYKGDKRIWGYDLLNEPVDNDVVEGCDDWQSLALRSG
jgi:hypothetical protein